MATEAAFPAPAGDLGVLLSGRLLLLPASVLQPPQRAPKAQTDVRSEMSGAGSLNLTMKEGALRAGT